MFSVIVLDFDGFLNQKNILNLFYFKENLTSINF